MNLFLFRPVVLALFSVFLVDAACGQGTGNNTNYFQPNIFPSGPNSMAFQKFGNYPVNLYSGLPDISIPLYTVEAGGLQVPIVLSYHGSGNKISDVASWAGLGWSINTGGTVTRTPINGLPDDNGYLKGDMLLEDSLLMPGHAFSNSDLLFFNQTVTNNGYDNMPDLFSYQIPGYTGKFFFDGRNNYQIEKIPFSPIKITGLTSGSIIGGFDIVDDHGNYFKLGHTYQELTGSTKGGGLTPLTAISAWMLEQMISQNKRDTINFTYTHELLSYPDGLQESVPVEDDGTGDLTYVHPTITPAINNLPPTVKEQQLSAITFKNGRVDFVLSASGRTDVGNNSGDSTTVRSLDSIKISAWNYAKHHMEVQKTVTFYTSYFNPGVGGSERLKLDSIHINDKAGAVVQRYCFTYNTTTNLPAYGSFARDFWGYYNGRTGFTDLIPKTTIQILTPSDLDHPISYTTIGTTDSTSRNCDSVAMQANILTRIDYPTGGYSTFTWQANHYYDGDDNLQLAGGLRIGAISSYSSQSATTPELVKTYKYNKARANFINSGGPLLNTGLFQNLQMYQLWTPTSEAPIVTATKRVRHFFAQPTVDLAPDGIPVAYSVVTEYDGTPTANIGKSIYRFRDSLADSFQGAAATGNAITYSFFYARGQLLEKRNYINKGAGVYQVASDEAHGYTAFPPRNYNYVGLAVGQNVYNDGVMAGAVAKMGSNNLPNDNASTYSWGYYIMVSDDNYEVNKTVTTYDINDTTKFVSSSIGYYYDDTTHQQIAHTAHADSRGNTRTTAYTYPYNYATGNSTIDAMVSDNMFAEAIEKTESYTISSSTTVTGAQLNRFKTGSLAGSIVPSTVSTLRVAQPLTNFVPSSVVSGALTADSRYQQMISFDSFDPQNNITQYTTRNARPTGILWDYSYELPIAQVKNATGTGLYTSFEANLGGGWIFTGTPVADPTAPTGSLVYPLSAGSVTSPTLVSGTPYILSCWSKGSAATVTPFGGSAITGILLNTNNGWSYYEYPVPSGTSKVTVSGTVAIDELRLYPAAAQMITYDYDPSGLRSISDAKGANGYFDYDFIQRLKNVKDWQGNIVKNYGYHTYDQVVGNQAQTGKFTSTTCTGGTISDTLVYTVPANKYYAQTLAAANADAVYDMNTNGQSKANATCACLVPFVLTNTLSPSVAHIPVTFTLGMTNYNVEFPTTGSKTFGFPAGTSYSIQVFPTGSFPNRKFILGSRAPVTAPGKTFTGVNITISGNESPLTVTNP